MTAERRHDYTRDILIGVVVMVVGGIVMKYADLPTRVTVIEVEGRALKETLGGIDKKMDIILRRMR